MSNLPYSGLLFGTAGVPHSANDGSTLAGVKRVAELGLGCMEVEFVQGVRMSRDMAREVGRVAQEGHVRLTVHAPYYMNLNSRDSRVLAASAQRLLASARMAWAMGATDVVFHPGFYHDDPPPLVLSRIMRRLKDVVDILAQEGNPVRLRPEVMGGQSQFGTLDEVLELSLVVPGMAPCIDFGHWHARTGGYNSYGEFVVLLDQVAAALGPGALKTMHIHVAGMEYGPKGERRHLVFAQSDFNYREFVLALKQRRVEGVVICESPNLEEDALLLKKEYEDRDENYYLPGRVEKSLLGATEKWTGLRFKSGLQGTPRGDRRGSARAGCSTIFECLALVVPGQVLGERRPPRAEAPWALLCHG